MRIIELKVTLRLTLHLSILMQWAEGGSLDDFIRARLGAPNSDGPLSSVSEEPQSRSARIRAFRAAQERPELRRARNSERQGRAVHFLSAEEVKSIFNDVVEGLGFLVSNCKPDSPLESDSDLCTLL